MNDAARSVRVTMIRPHLEGLPVVSPPAGFTLRLYQPDDATAWVRIHQEAGHVHAVSPELHTREFAAGEVPLRQRQFFLCAADGREIGTATAWFDEDHHGESWGRLHWVAVSEAYQGRGLGRVLVSAACLRLRELGHPRVYLRTQPDRVKAIQLYLSFGFVPEIRDAANRREWEQLQRRGLAVNLPTLAP